MAKTKTDPGVIARALDDEPMQLREWGTDRTHGLPVPRSGEFFVGASSDCWLHMQDREQYVSRKHALLRFDAAGWIVADAGSKNGLWIDGRRSDSALLSPGTEIGIGRVRLVVESPRTIRSRALLARLLGWRPDRQSIVDRASRVLREYEAARLPLWLSGGDDLVAIARRLHREVLGDDSPFVVRDREAGHEPNENAFREARSGTLCIHAQHRPIDARSLRALSADREPQCRVIVCARSTDPVRSIEIPPLDSREDELARIIDDYAADALAQLRAKPGSFTHADRQWLVEHAPSTLAQIETATLRLVAIREFGGVTHAAPHLGITHSALSRWLARRIAPRPNKSKAREI